MWFRANPRPKLGTYYRDLEKFAVGYDKNLGRLRWCQGDALIKAKAQLKHGQWGKFLTMNSIPSSTDYLLRQIAGTIVEQQSMKLSYQEMCADIDHRHRKRH